jgi:hypothetical protein
MGIFAIIQTVLTILSEYLQWQVALTKINARKLAYDLDQQILKEGRELSAKIDYARNAGDLVATSMYLDDQANAALFAARIRSAIPDVSGPDVGVSSGIPTVAASGSGPHNRA